MKITNTLLSILLACLSIMTMQAVMAQEIIAHRGASYLAPENTLASVKLGYELGADAVEIDIHLSKDHRIMVNHDKDSKRTAGGKNLIIKDTDAAELRRLEVGSWKEEKYKGEKIPFLEEVFSLVPAGKMLIIEVKSAPEIIPFLKQKIEESGIRDRLVIISFNKEVVVQAKKQMPAIPVYWLLHNYKHHSLSNAIRVAKENKLDGLNVHHKLVNKAFMKHMEEANLGVYVYTVNDPTIARKLTSLGVNGITTDRPQWLRNQLQL